MREAIRFIVIVLMTFATLAIEIIKYLGEYSIKFSHILVHLVHVSTPIWLGMMEFFTKCVGGMYWLIFVLIRGTPNTPAVPSALMNNQKSIAYRKSFGNSDCDQSYSSSRQSFSPRLDRTFQRQY